MQHGEKINLTRLDRWGYVAGGLALLSWGLRQRNLLGGGLAGLGGWLLYQAYTGYNPMFQPLGIRVNRAPAEKAAAETIVIDQAITINAPRAELYRYWRDLSNLPKFAPRITQVDVLGERNSRWHFDGGAAGKMVWESEITEDQPDTRISWRAMHKTALHHFGTVEFRDAPGGRGTVVGIHLEYVSPVGALGSAMARVTGQAPERFLTEALRRLKQLIEVGEVVTTEGQSAGAGRGATTTGEGAGAH